jgi:mRNA interferase RelE/StbE
MSLQVLWDQRASDAIEALARRDPRLARRIRQRVASFAASGHGDIQKLTGTTNEWRLRVGDWRAVFAFDPPGSITVLAVAPRRDVYRP